MLERFLNTEDGDVSLSPFYRDKDIISLRKALRRAKGFLPPDHEMAPDHRQYLLSKGRVNHPMQAYFGIWGRGRIVGDIDLVIVRAEPRTYAISYNIGHEYEEERGRYGSLALKAVTRHAIVAGSAKRVEATCLISDEVGMRSLEEAGYDSIEGLGSGLLRYSKDIVADVIEFPMRRLAAVQAS